MAEVVGTVSLFAFAGLLAMPAPVWLFTGQAKPITNLDPLEEEINSAGVWWCNWIILIVRINNYLRKSFHEDTIKVVCCTSAIITIDISDFVWDKRRTGTHWTGKCWYTFLEFLFHPPWINMS